MYSLPRPDLFFCSSFMKEFSKSANLKTFDCSQDVASKLPGGMLPNCRFSMTDSILETTNVLCETHKNILEWVYADCLADQTENGSKTQYKKSRLGLKTLQRRVKKVERTCGKVMKTCKKAKFGIPCT